MPAPSEAQQVVCGVCAEPVTPEMSAACNWCNDRYHLNPRNDIEAKDCGQVWIDDQYMALQFACNNCLAQQADAVPAPPDSAASRDVATTRLDAHRASPAGRRRYRRRQ